MYLWFTNPFPLQMEFSLNQYVAFMLPFEINFGEPYSTFMQIIEEFFNEYELELTRQLAEEKFYQDLTDAINASFWCCLVDEIEPDMERIIHMYKFMFQPWNNKFCEYNQANYLKLFPYANVESLIQHNNKVSAMEILCDEFLREEEDRE